MDRSAKERGLTWRALLIALGVLVLTALWVRQAELIADVNNISETVPSMPGIGALLLLALLSALGPAGRWVRGISRAERLVIYGFVSVGVMPLALTWIRWFLPFQIIPFYFDRTNGALTLFQRYLPPWLAPHDREVVRQFYEGSPDGQVPWGAWIGPLVVWFVFLMLLWITLLCLMTLVRRQWMEGERLGFPLLYLPLNIVGERPGTVGERPFFRHPLMWLGFGLECTHNLLNVLNKYYPEVPALGQRFDLQPLLTDPPWNQIGSLLIMPRMELIGLGYLMPADILLTIGVTHLAGQFLRVGLAGRGYEVREFPYGDEQAVGAYAAFVLFALWTARGHLARVFRKVLFDDPRVRDDEPMSYRMAVAGLVTGTAGILFFLHLAGMRVLPAAAFLGAVFLMALGYARVRAESGAPILRAFPNLEIMALPVGLVGSEALLNGMGLPTLTIWSSLYALGAQTFIPAPAYHLELFKLGDHAGVRRSQMALVSVLALAVGIVLAYAMLLSTSYRVGGVLLESVATGPGGYAARYAREQYGQVAGWLTTPEAADPAKQVAVVAGAALAAGMSLARVSGLAMPFHPTGYVIGLNMGALCWFPALFVWFLKSTIVRLGGPVLYRRLIPLFLGLALGEFFSAGLVIGLLGALIPALARAYQFWYL